MATGKTFGDDIFPLPMPVIGTGKPGDYFLLKATDGTFDPAACPEIGSGDWLIVREQAIVADGELVAVMIDGHAEVRQFERMDDDDWKLIGKVTHVLHRVAP